MKGVLTLTPLPPKRTTRQINTQNIIDIDVYLHQIHKNSWFNGLGLLRFDLK